MKLTKKKNAWCVKIDAIIQTIKKVQTIYERETD